LYHNSLLHRNVAKDDKFTDQLKSPPAYIIDVIENSLTVAPTDVSAKGGVDISSAKKDLLLLASLTAATLQVTDDGDVVYSFPSDFKQRLLQRSIAARVNNLYQTLYPFIILCNNCHIYKNSFREHGAEIGGFPVFFLNFWENWWFDGWYSGSIPE
jgi:hypothetical protein